MAGVPLLEGLGRARTHGGGEKKSSLVPKLLESVGLLVIVTSCAPAPDQTPIAPTKAPTEGIPTPNVIESPIYKQLDAIREKVLELASKVSGVSVLDSATQDKLTESQKTTIKQLQDSQQANIDTILSTNSPGANITLVSTQAVSATTDDGASFEFGFSTLTYTNKADNKAIGNAITFQFKDSEGKVVNATLFPDQEQTVDGKTVRRFLALPEVGGGLAFPAIIAVYDNPTDASPSQAYVLQPDGNNFKVMPLVGDGAEIKNFADSIGQTENISFKIVKPVPMIEVGGLQIPDPKASNPELFDLTKADSPIVQFANAFGVKPEEVGNLTPQLLTGIDGKQFVVLTTGDLAATTTFDESGTPLLIAEQGENGEWKWSEATLKNIGSLYFIDNGGTMSYLSGKDPRLTDLMKNQFSIYWTENDLKWNKIETTQGVLTASRKDNITNEAIEMMKKKFGMKLVGHSLINWESYADYVKKETDPEKLLKMMQEHIKLVMQAFPDIDTWEVVNEYHPNGPNPDYLRDKIGNYVISSFETARLANPKAKLLLSDNSLPDIKLIEELKQKGLIDGISIHFHLNENGIPPGYLEALKAYGIPIYISELDINIKNLDINDPQRFIKQAAIAEDVGKLCKALGPNCIAINQWNVGDNNSWYETGGAPKDRSSPNADATFFFDDLSLKPSFFALLKGLVEQ